MCWLLFLLCASDKCVFRPESEGGLDPLTFVPSSSGLRGEVLGLQSQLTLRLQNLHYSASGLSELLDLQSF